MVHYPVARIGGKIIEEGLHRDHPDAKIFLASRRKVDRIAKGVSANSKHKEESNLGTIFNMFKFWLGMSPNY